MLESSVELLRCIRCGAGLECDVFRRGREIEEGLLECKKCRLAFPVIDGIPVMWDDFAGYLSRHKILGGMLYRMAGSAGLRKFVKSSLSKATFADDVTRTEHRWSKIYQDSRNSRFYSLIRARLASIPAPRLVLEHGCSIGIISSHLADSAGLVFGVDRSFTALQHAKRSFKDNLDYLLADSLSPVFGGLKFDLVLALNVLELIEPVDLLKHAARQVPSGHLVVSDPYDFERGASSVKKPLDESSLRAKMERLGFEISPQTKTPSRLPWSLKLNPRATLNYKVDLVIGKRP